MPKGEKSARLDVKDADVTRLYQSGLTTYEVAARLHLSQPTVIHRLKRAGVARRTRWQQFTATTPEEAVAMYLSGLGSTEVAKRIGVTAAAIRNYVVRAGHKMRPKQNPIVTHGPDNPSWKGGRFTDTYGYVYVRLGNKQYIREHRHVVSELIGRPLADDEIVHHLNGIRHDNRPGNLVITTRKKHEHYTLVKSLQARIRELERSFGKRS